MGSFAPESEDARNANGNKRKRSVKVRISVDIGASRKFLSLVSSLINQSNDHGLMEK